MKFTPIALAAALALGTTAAPSFAGQVRVTYADLDLSTPAGQQKLQERLETAAKQACEYDRVTTGSRLRSAESQKCYAEAKRQAGVALARIVEKEGLGG